MNFAIICKLIPGVFLQEHTWVINRLYSSSILGQYACPASPIAGQPPGIFTTIRLFWREERSFSGFALP